MSKLTYMLDTDIASYVMKGFSSNVNDRLRATRVGEVSISVINKAELLFGVALSPRQKHDEAALHAFLRNVVVLEFPEEAADHYAQIRAHLKIKGTLIGSNDLWVAAHARALDLVLVTNNVREYGRVPGLKIENWTEPQP